METGEAGPREVTHVWVHDDTLVQFTVGGADVWTTHDHPFWNATDQQWQWAGAFDAGDMVLTAYGEQLTSLGTRPGMWTYGDAYNLTVDDIHTYFVVIGDADVLVHNSGIGCGWVEGSAGSTGRWVPANAAESAAMESVLSNPRSGDVLGTVMNDGRWPASEGWKKMAQEVDGIEIHYVWQEGTENFDDFKFVAAG